MSKQFVLRRRSKKKRQEGLLESYPPALTQSLRPQRYQRDTLRRYLHAVDPFAQWLKTPHLTVAEIEETVVARYIVSHGYRTIRITGHKHRPQTAIGLAHLLQVLHAQGVSAPPSPRVPTTPTEQLLAAYDPHVTRVHGAAPRTRHKYLYFAQQFLQAAFPTGHLQWNTLDAERITTIVQHQTRGRRGLGRKGRITQIGIFI